MAKPIMPFINLLCCGAVLYLIFESYNMQGVFVFDLIMQGVYMFDLIACRVCICLIL